MWAILHRIAGLALSMLTSRRFAQAAKSPAKVKWWNRIVRLSVGGWPPHGNSLERCWRYLSHRSKKFDHKGSARFAGWLLRKPSGFAWSAGSRSALFPLRGKKRGKAKPRGDRYAFGRLSLCFWFCGFSLRVAGVLIHLLLVVASWWLPSIWLAAAEARPEALMNESQSRSESPPAVPEASPNSRWERNIF